MVLVSFKNIYMASMPIFEGTFFGQFWANWAEMIFSATFGVKIGVATGHHAHP